ncbi:isopeptide-forming domain-containing fimbrial protein [Bacillus cereus]|uniref:isopeptide-forming domain-containing fimbrial protein n=1 Tax=Bacillus cereus TaxID=1396 RepID=UPI001596FFDA|nr:isopeptide-forming domain-containing fimbrial protein [Bacillus cereus]
MRKIVLSIMTILLVFSGLNISVAETFIREGNPEMNRLLPDGSKTKDPGIVTKGEDITLDVSYFGAADKKMIIPLGDHFTYNEERTKELLKDQQDVNVIYQKEKQQLEVTWKAENKESVVFSLNASKAGQTAIKAVEQQQKKIESNILEIDIQDAKASEDKNEEKVTVQTEEQTTVDNEVKRKEAIPGPRASTGIKFDNFERHVFIDSLGQLSKPVTIPENTIFLASTNNTQYFINNKLITQETKLTLGNTLRVTNIGRYGDRNVDAIFKMTAESATGDIQVMPTYHMITATNGIKAFSLTFDRQLVFNDTDEVVQQPTYESNIPGGKERVVSYVDADVLMSFTKSGKSGMIYSENPFLEYELDPRFSTWHIDFLLKPTKTTKVKFGSRESIPMQHSFTLFPTIMNSYAPPHVVGHTEDNELLAKYSITQELPIQFFESSYPDEYRLQLKPNEILVVDKNTLENLTIKDNKGKSVKEKFNLSIDGSGEIIATINRENLESISGQPITFDLNVAVDTSSEKLLDYYEDPYLIIPLTAKNSMNGLESTDDAKVKLEKITNTPPVIQLDNDGEYTDNGYHIQGVWKDEDSENVSLYYTVDGSEPKKMGDYNNPNQNTDVPWEYTIPNSEVEQGLDHDITVYVIDEDDLQSNIETIQLRPALTITEKVLDADGNEAKEIAPGETLSYEVLVDSGYIAKDKGTYGDVIITQNYDTHLEVPTDLKVTNESGDEIGTAMYNASTNSIEVKLNADTPRSTKVKVTYSAKVKEDASEGEFVVSQATASGKYSTGDEVDQTSNEVKVMITGVLKFVSAPTVIDFGRKLKISPQDKTYYPIKLDTPLTVKDTRSLSKKPSWMMTAKLGQPLIGKKTGSTLNGLHYRYGGNESILSEDAAVEIYKKETTDKQVFNISDAWSQDGDGLYLKVKAGTAKTDAYEGSIHWILQDVPPNN